ncbi:hypothetical protein [Streptomyces sp. ISL-86]|uniref:hypothetical protein n=1 Tax=Streptomyces sp. ISL-86 TaxID=2819187 RepID=UPI001BEABE2D|nr:hypothetical protein [Streptomyces sp. ISL-86]MBT2453659.1 hypothetical protein [Streptomyces sp. ISL-86]
MSTPAARLRAWLLDHPRITEGPHTGGVVGDTGNDAYVYPEIAGYYLTWLAFLATAESAAEPAIERADAARIADARDAAVRWLNGELRRPDGPRTRCHLTTTPETAADWRNHARFTFDLGMVHRGAAAGTGPGTAALLARTAELLDGMRDADGSWLGCRPHGSSAPLPERWSTAPGPHLLKVAGGVLALAAPDHTRTVLEAARETLARHAPELKAGLPTMSHPALYALEGLLQAEAAGYREHHEELLHGYHLLAAQPGGVPREYVARPDSRVRSDVVAQLLRVGCVLADRGELDETERAALDRLAALLADRVGPTGALPFEDGSAHGNTWCAMFAHQALVFHARLTEGRPIPDAWVRLLV